MYDKLASYISRRLFSSQTQALNVKTEKKKKKKVFSSRRLITVEHIQFCIPCSRMKFQLGDFKQKLSRPKGYIHFLFSR